MRGSAFQQQFTDLPHAQAGRTPKQTRLGLAQHGLRNPWGILKFLRQHVQKTLFRAFRLQTFHCFGFHRVSSFGDYGAVILLTEGTLVTI
jgi:hypothetical protein